MSLSRLHFGVLRKFEPFASNVKPYFLIEGIFELLGYLSGFLGPFSVLRGIFRHVGGLTGYPPPKRVPLKKKTKFKFGN